MNRSRIVSCMALVVALAALFAPQSAEACSVCMGDPNSNVTKGIGWAILTLGGIIGSVLGMLGAFFIFLAKRANSPEALEMADA